MNNRLVNTVREKVSADRNRFNDGKYNLDLAYITPNIIAMGFPADGITAVYRNHIDQVSSKSVISLHHSRILSRIFACLR